MNHGAAVGSYRILGKLGEGGMGEVYRAHDTRLRRDVALKVLPTLVAADPDRLARFEREAQLLASLNHPNIAQIYGVEDSHDGVRALVMELVEGPTLADRIAGGPISLDEALPIARQIAEALEAAHEQGIVHRDLKPANVKVRPDGTVKVLDFGLAKALEPALAPSGSATESPTITSPAMTRMGMILGTAAYMSPEQAKGRQADKRSDVWAFGAVLYEMLSGRRAFKGDDIADTLAAVLRQEIDWTALPAPTPSSLKRLLARCLERDPKRRLRDIGEARITLEDPSALAALESAPVTPPETARRRARTVAVALVAALLTGTAVWFLMRRGPAPPLAVTRSTIVLPEGQQFPIAVSMRRLLAISPDGTRLVYAGPSGLYLRPMADLNAVQIAGTDSFQAVSDPAFSPDGRSIAFFASGDKTLKTIEVAGGAAVTICQVADTFGISWQRDAILYGQGRAGIMRVSPDGHTPETLARVKAGEEAHGPQLLPDGEHFLFTVATGTHPARWDAGRIVVQSLKSGEQKTIIEGGSDARYVPTGHIVYSLGASLYAVRFDATRLQVTSRPALMVEGVRRPPGGATGTAQYDWSATGSLVYIPGPNVSPMSRLEVVLVDRQGRVEPLKLPAGPYLSPRVSPDGKRMAFFTDDGKEAIVWTYELSGASAKVRLTYGGNNRFPIWSADGTRIAFQSDREGDLAVFWQAADGTGAAARLTKPEKGTAHVPESWSPKNDAFLYSVKSDSDLSLWTFSLRERKSSPFNSVHSLNASGAAFSPDGRWVAYSTTVGGSTTISVQPFPPTGARYELFGKDGDVPHMPAWSPDGKELFFDPRAGGFEAASITTHPTFAFGNPVAVPHPFQLGPAGARRAYDVAPDGRFLGLLPAGQKEFLTPITPQIQVVLNWFEELKGR